MRRLPLSLVVPLLSASLLLAGCGGDDETPADGGEGDPTVSEGRHHRGHLAADRAARRPGDEDVEQTHPVLVTKIDNTSSAQPAGRPRQRRPGRRGAGRGRADPAGGLLLLRPAERVGPVRSMRASDIGIVSPVDAVSGHQRRGGADDRPDPATPGSPSTRRARRGSTATRPAARRTTCSPTSTADRRDRGQGEPARPDDYLPWGDAGRPARRASRPPRSPASFSGGHTTEWAYRDGGYVNTNTQRRRRTTSSRPTPCWCCGSRSATPATSTRPATRCPRPSSRAPGQAMLFHGGRVVRGTWTKDGLRQHPHPEHQGGRPGVPAGHTWIELVPQSAEPALASADRGIPLLVGAGMDA